MCWLITTLGVSKYAQIPTAVESFMMRAKVAQSCTAHLKNALTYGRRVVTVHAIKTISSNRIFSIGLEITSLIILATPPLIILATPPLIILATPSLIILAIPSLVILSAAKDLVPSCQILRGVYTERSECAQDDTGWPIRQPRLMS